MREDFLYPQELSDHHALTQEALLTWQTVPPDVQMQNSQYLYQQALQSLGCTLGRLESVWLLKEITEITSIYPSWVSVNHAWSNPTLLLCSCGPVSAGRTALSCFSLIQQFWFQTQTQNEYFHIV